VEGTSYDCFGVVQRLSKISMAEIDVSVFSKMAELLARPLSPTALEKEEAAKTQNGKRVPKAKVPSRKAAARPKAESKAAASMQAAAPLIKEADAEEPMTSKEHSTFSEDKGILSAVSELSGLQQEWKEKMKHPAFRKGGPPRMKRPPAPAVLDEEERRQKMEEIDTLEVQLKEAKTLAAAAKRAAQAAEQLAEAAAKEVESGSEDGQISQSTEPKKELPEGDLQQQAEARVKARKRQEAKEQRDRQRKEAEEKRLKQAEAEAKAKELERHAKERIQERIRSERARERQQQEELEREAEFKEQRSRQVAEELQQQALKRLSDKEHAEKHLADELAKAEAEAKRLQAQENHARAEELRQKTRRRVQQYTRQQRDQSMAQEEARRKRMEEEAQVAEDKIMQAIRSQERAKARATEFKHRERSVEKAKAMLQGEQEVRQQELAEVAQLERQRKRHWRAELARRPATPLRSDISSRASSHPPLTRPAPRPADLGGGRSAESSRASTPNCPMWAIVDSAGNEEGHRPKPQLPKPTQESVKKVPLQRLTRAVSQPPIRPKAVERVEHVEPVVPRVQSSGSGDQSRASTPVDHWDEPDFVEEVTAYPENPRLNSAKAPSLDEASVPSSPGGKSPKPWKQRAIQVNSTEHYLEALKAARGHQPKAAKSRPAPGSKGYAEQLRLRAEDVEAKQREEEDVRMERGYAALQRVQQRALQASPMRGARAG